MFTLFFQDQPLVSKKSWQEVADLAIANGFAFYAFNTLFTMLPGVTIR